MNLHTQAAASKAGSPPRSRGHQPDAGEAQRQANHSIGAASGRCPADLRAETPTGEAGAPIPLHLIPTIRNNQLPTAELAERLGVSEAAIDAIRALGEYCGGDPLATSRLVARDLGSAVVL